MPEFLRTREVLYNEVETVVVHSMHERKALMFAESDGFVVMPGGIGTMEEVVELLSWRRLDLHRKPTVFVNLNGFWDPFYAFMQHTVDARLTPGWVMGAWRSVDRVQDVLPALQAPMPTPN
jgi:uncharacterized protein (TIGR00730 family)